jgi:FkbM family methyltransferase
MRAIKTMIHSSLRKLGYRIVRIDPEEEDGYGSGLRAFFRMLKQQGFAPAHIIDVGANKGRWTRQAIRFFPDASYTLIEPQDNLKSYVQDLIDQGYKIRWINAGAGDMAGKLPFTVSHRDDSSTFVLSKEEAQRAGMQQVTVEVKTLNEVAAEVGAPPPDMVKIDAEGFDLKVLTGATELLGKTDIFLVEACICSPGENKLLAVTKQMADAGYRLIDITDLYRSPRFGVMWLCELAFLRNGSALLDSANSFE